MTYFLRADGPRNRWLGKGGDEIGRMRLVAADGAHVAPHDARAVFVVAAPLVMHDECADRHGVGGHPWDHGRESFSAQAGQPLCWAPRYSTTPTVPCYWCGDPVA